ncbi:hypothetical protein DZE40_001203 [Clostridium beijerinckii]|nr:hypothetical protein [Clostridium beijerinckii]
MKVVEYFDEIDQSNTHSQEMDQELSSLGSSY